MEALVGVVICVGFGTGATGVALVLRLPTGLVALPHSLPGLHGRLVLSIRLSVPAAVGVWELSDSSSGPGLPTETPSISASVTPFCLSKILNRLFSSSTRLAAAWSSADASTPTASQVRYLVSSSCKYSLLRARERRWLSRMRARFAFCFLQAVSGGGPCRKAEAITHSVSRLAHVGCLGAASERRERVLAYVRGWVWSRRASGLDGGGCMGFWVWV